MNTEPLEIREGMEVYASDGEKIGSVAQVWTNVTDTTTAVASIGYFQVDQGGVLGIGASHLYIPFSSVDDLVPGECVTINCAKSECSSRYEQEPDFLGQSTSQNTEAPPLV